MTLEHHKWLCSYYSLPFDYKRDHIRSHIDQVMAKSVHGQEEAFARGKCQFGFGHVKKLVLAKA